MPLGDRLGATSTYGMPARDPRPPQTVSLNTLGDSREKIDDGSQGCDWMWWKEMRGLGEFDHDLRGQWTRRDREPGPTLLRPPAPYIGRACSIFVSSTSSTGVCPSRSWSSRLTIMLKSAIAEPAHMSIWGNNNNNNIIQTHTASKDIHL